MNELIKRSYIQYRNFIQLIKVKYFTIYNRFLSKINKLILCNKVILKNISKSIRVDLNS